MSQILTIDDLNTYTKKTLDAGVAQLAVDGVNNWVETRTNRCWGETKTVVERHDWGKTLWLRHQDVTAISAIKTGWPGQSQATVDSTGYFFNSYGRVTLFWQRFGGLLTQSALYADYVEVDYSYGVLSVPADLKLAAISIGVGFYNYAANGNQDVVAATVGSYHLQFSGSVRGVAGSADPAKSTADANWGIIDSYKQKRM